MCQRCRYTIAELRSHVRTVMAVLVSTVATIGGTTDCCLAARGSAWPRAVYRYIMLRSLLLCSNLVLDCHISTSPGADRHAALNLPPARSHGTLHRRRHRRAGCPNERHCGTSCRRWERAVRRRWVRRWWTNAETSSGTAWPSQEGENLAMTTSPQYCQRSGTSDSNVVKSH